MLPRLLKKLRREELGSLNIFTTINIDNVDHLHDSLQGSIFAILGNGFPLL